MQKEAKTKSKIAHDNSAMQEAEIDSPERKSENQISKVNESEVLRNVMVALARAVNINQALEIVLVNLQNLIHYDRAGFFLLDQNRGYVLVEKALQDREQPAETSMDKDPLVLQMLHTKRPVIVSDIRFDERFLARTDMQSVRAWMGAPLFAGDEMIGFISLGSLEVGAYKSSDSEIMHSFTSQVADVIERAWLHEQSYRKTEEIEVLSNFSIALSRADSRENTLSAILDQVTKLFGAVEGTFLFPDKNESSLVVRYSQKESLIGISHPKGEDLLWEVIHTGRTVIIKDVNSFLVNNSFGVYQKLFEGIQSAVVIAMNSQDSTVGLLCISFAQRRYFPPDEINLFNAIAEIAGASLQRVVVLEALEEQVGVRTQHLSTLYKINTVASAPAKLREILEQVLIITLEALDMHKGTIHLLDAESKDLQLIAQRNIEPNLGSRLQTLLLSEKFWNEALNSSSPTLIADVIVDVRFPKTISGIIDSSKSGYIGISIQAKGKPLGLLSIFTGKNQDYTLEDITLCMTIADQIGFSVERARLIDQAEQIAVVEERQRLARELHDSVAQMLYSQVLFAGAGLKEFNHGNLALVQQHLSQIDQAAQQALKEMRLLVYELRPVDKIDEGFESELQHRLDAVEKRSGIYAQLSIIGEINLSRATETALIRIAEEALNNSLKHAHASEVSIEFRSDSDHVNLKITDNGKGFILKDKLNEGGMGLKIMEERIDKLGGTFNIASTVGVGTCIDISIKV